MGDDTTIPEIHCILSKKRGAIPMVFHVFT
jgi:hypothetical protein